MDEPTELPDGTVLQLVLHDGGDELDESERSALDGAISRSLEQVRAGETAPAEAVLAELGARRGG